MTRDVASRSFPAAWAGIAREIVAVFRVRVRTLLIAGAVIFVPLGLIETIDATVWERIGEADEIGALDAIEIAAIGSVHVLGSLLGEVIFAGVVTASVLAERRGGGTSLRASIAELSKLRLALADLAYTLAVVLGLLLLIVPGLVFIVWYSLLAPVIEVENRPLRAAFSRSRELVRLRPWLVASFVLPIIALDET